MITVNSISGGKSSAYMAAHYPADYEVFALVCLDAIDCAPKDKSIIHYVNAKIEKYIPEYGEFIATAEDDQTLYAMRDLEQYLGREIIWTRGISYDKLIDERYKRVQLGNIFRLPSWARRYCTEEMKLLTIFMWWFWNIGEKCKMRIGFRADEFDRMLRFFNNSDPVNFSIPVACSTKGKRLQRHENFNWRFCDMPLARGGVDKADVASFWKNKTVGGNLFEPSRIIKFPEISNCIFCFHKIKETLLLMAILHPNKMSWAAAKELLGMGTWLDSRETYQSIIDEANAMSDEDKEFLIRKLLKVDGSACDVGGCTD